MVVVVCMVEMVVAVVGWTSGVIDSEVSEVGLTGPSRGGRGEEGQGLAPLSHSFSPSLSSIFSLLSLFARLIHPNTRICSRRPAPDAFGFSLFTGNCRWIKAGCSWR